MGVDDNSDAEDRSENVHRDHPEQSPSTAQESRHAEASNEPEHATQHPDTNSQSTETAPDDSNMSPAEHIDELMKRLSVVVLFGGIATLLVYPFAEQLIEYLWSSHIPNPTDNPPRLYGPLEFVLTRVKVAGLAGLLVSLPAVVYQTYRYMRPGLYPNERRYYLAAVPTSLVLGGVGGVFAHFLLLPAIFTYFTSYTEDAAVVAFGLGETFSLILVMIGFMTIVFQIPLFVMLATMMNVVTRQWLEDKRLIMWGVFAGIAFVFSPDPTGMAPIIIAVLMIVLYEGTLAMLRWTGN